MSDPRPSTVLSVVIPIYNELDTWRELVRRVSLAPLGDVGLQVILIDDAGFGGPDTFGGGIRTPNLRRVQERGITYNRFHVTAVCSP